MARKSPGKATTRKKVTRRPAKKESGTAEENLYIFRVVGFACIFNGCGWLRDILSDRHCVIYSISNNSIKSSTIIGALLTHQDSIHILF